MARRCQCIWVIIMSIVIKSGNISGAPFIREERNIAIKRGFQDGLFLAWVKFEPTVAKKTGRMRRSFARALSVLAQGATVSSSGEISITWEEIKEIVIALTHYSKYHFKARGFYANPTTANTRPMRFRAFKFHAVRLITRKIQAHLTLLGLEASPFSVM